jgi:hypothetical protein
LIDDNDDAFSSCCGNDILAQLCYVTIRFKEERVNSSSFKQKQSLDGSNVFVVYLIGRVPTVPRTLLL